MNQNENETNKETKEQNQQTSKTSRQVEEQTEPKKSRWKQNLIFFSLFCMTAVFMYWTNKVTVPQNQTLIMFITISVLVNICIVLLLFGTGIGIELIKRFLNKFRYKSGNFVNSLHVMKSGVIKERFVKKDNETGVLRMVEKPYVTNPKLMYNYKGIPTYLHRDGNPDPLNIWDDKIAGELSNSEMDIAMNSKGAFDVKEWLQKNKSMILIVGIAVVGVSFAAAFFGYQTYEMLRDGTFKQISSVACNNLPEPVKKIAESTLGG